MDKKMAPRDTTQKIAEITAGNIWKPVTFKVIFKFLRPTSSPPPEGGKGRPLKCLIGDSSGLIILLYNMNDESDYERLQVNQCYTIMAGGCSSSQLNTKYKHLLLHPNGMELWLRDINKLVPEPTTVMDHYKAPLNFDFVNLSKLAKGSAFDILAKVDMQHSEQEDHSNVKIYKSVYLVDESLVGNNKIARVRCNLMGEHCDLLKGDEEKVIAFYNAFVASVGNDLIIWANNSCATFLVTSPDFEWVLNDSQRLLKNGLVNLDTADYNNCIKKETENQMEIKVKRKLDREDPVTPSKKSRLVDKTSSLPDGKPFQFKNIAEFQKKLQETPATFFRAEISRLHVELNCTIRRYLGCSKCLKSLRVENGSYYCVGKLCQDGPNTRNNIDQRKSCYLLKNLTVHDETLFIDSLIAYNSTVENFLGKPADEFDTDNEVSKRFQSLVQNRLLSLLVQAKPLTSEPSLNLNSEDWDLTVSKITLTEILVPEPVPVVPAIGSTSTVFVDDDIEISTFLAKRVAFDVKVIPSSGKELDIIEEDEYVMKSKPRGIALHVCTTEGRRGYKYDVETFEILFSQLHYIPQTVVDVSSEKLPKVLKECREKMLKGNYESFVLCISCHGLSNRILLADGKLINVWTDVIYQFDDTNFPEFRGRPKIVFLNACQSFPEAAHPITLSTPTTAPNHPDLLLFISTSPGFQSFRNPDIGSHFIRTLAYVAMRHAHHMEIKKLFYKVAKILHQPDETAMQNPQLPEVRDFIFSKLFYFRP